MSPTDKPASGKDEEDILNLALEKAVGADTSYRYHLRLPPPLSGSVKSLNKQDSLEKIRWRQWEDSLKAVLDTATLFVVVKTNYDSLTHSDIESIQANMTSPDFFKEMDGPFIEALQALCITPPQKDSFTLAALRPKYNYKLYHVRSYPKDKLRMLGSISFSQIGYNKEKDRACIYTSFVCGGLCGYGQIHFLQKQKGSWQLVNSWEMWVS